MVFMNKNMELKEEIEELRNLLNIVACDMESNDCNYKIIMETSLKLDKLILEYIKK